MTAGPMGAALTAIVASGRRSRLLTAAAFGLAGGMISVLGSGTVSLWKDEVDSISGAQRSVSDLLRLVQNIDAVHGLYYLILHEWIQLAGRSPFAVRFPSALAIAAASAGLYLLTHAVAGRHTAIVATAAFVLLPRVTWMGIEARSFAFTATLAVALSLALVNASSRPTHRIWVTYGALTFVAVVLNVYLALMVTAHGVTLAWSGERRRNVWSGWLLAAVIGATLAAPAALVAASQSGQLGDNVLGPATMLRSVVVNQWFLGNAPGGADSPPLSFLVDEWRAASTVLALAGWVLIGLARTTRRAARTEERAAEPHPIGPLELALPWVVLPTAVVLVWSIVISPMYNPRYLGFTAPAAAILISVGLRRIRPRVVRRVVPVVMVALVLPVYLSQRRQEAKQSDWSEVARFVDRHKAGDQGVYFTPRRPPRGPTVGSTTRYAMTAYPAAFAGLRDLTMLTTGAHDGTLTGQSQLLAASADRLVGVAAVWVIRRLDYPLSAVEADDAFLIGHGFRPQLTWTGPYDKVVQFVRR